MCRLPTVFLTELSLTMLITRKLTQKICKKAEEKFSKIKSKKAA